MAAGPIPMADAEPAKQSGLDQQAGSSNIKPDSEMLASASVSSSAGASSPKELKASDNSQMHQQSKKQSPAAAASSTVTERKTKEFVDAEQQLSSIKGKRAAKILTKLASPHENKAPEQASPSSENNPTSKPTSEQQHLASL